MKERGHPPVIDLTGKRFGRWTVLRRHGHSKDRLITWWCRCDCGTEKAVVGSNLKGGDSKSCGCLMREAAGVRARKHGHTLGRKATPEYEAFHGAKRRCNDTKDDAYKYYGGRGIKFLYESFAQFLADVGKRPSAKHSLDRKDNDGNYEPGNCRWATKKEQMKNRNVYHPQCDGSMTTPIDEIILAHIRRKGKVMEKL